MHPEDFGNIFTAKPPKHFIVYVFGKGAGWGGGREGGTGIGGPFIKP